MKCEYFLSSLAPLRELITPGWSYGKESKILTWLVWCVTSCQIDTIHIRVQWRIQDFWKGRAGNPNAVMPRQAWKSRSAGGGGGGGGGDSDTFFFFFFFFFFLLIYIVIRHLHLCGRGTVRLPDRPPGWKAKQKKKKKKKKRPKKRGGAAADSAPPPLDPPLRVSVFLSQECRITIAW